jgi:hypothetical protein
MINTKYKQNPKLCINVREYRSGNQQMDNPENLATYGTQDEEKQNKNTKQYVFDTTMRKQTHIT